MKKKLAALLVGLAKWISPVEAEARFRVVEDYEPLRVGNSYLLTKQEVRKYRKEHPEIESFRKARIAAIEKVKGDIRLGIFKKIIDDGLFQFKVVKGKGEEQFDTVVSCYLNIYVPAKNEKPEEQDAT